MVTSCVGPARTDDAYRGKAATTADHVRSSVETAIIGLQAADRHGLQSAYVSTLLAEAEDDAAASDDTFASIQPPSGRSDQVRREARAVVGEAVDELAQLRITSRRGDLSHLEPSVRRLQALASALDRLASSLRG